MPALRHGCGSVINLLVVASVQTNLKQLKSDHNDELNAGNEIVLP